MPKVSPIRKQLKVVGQFSEDVYGGAEAFNRIVEFVNRKVRSAECEEREVIATLSIVVGGQQEKLWKGSLVVGVTDFAHFALEAVQSAEMRVRPDSKAFQKFNFALVVGGQQCGIRFTLENLLWEDETFPRSEAEELPYLDAVMAHTERMTALLVNSSAVVQKALHAELTAQRVRIEKLESLLLARAKG